jgi:hypothetical protein
MLVPQDGGSSASCRRGNGARTRRFQLPFQPCRRATEADVGIPCKRQMPIASPPDTELIRFLELARIAPRSAYHETDGSFGRQAHPLISM